MTHYSITFYIRQSFSCANHPILYYTFLMKTLIDNLKATHTLEQEECAVFFYVLAYTRHLDNLISINLDARFLLFRDEFDLADR